MLYIASISTKMRSGSHGFCMISDYEKMGAALGVEVSQSEHDSPEPGRWFHLGVGWFCDESAKNGFEVLDRYVGVVARDPVVHFRRV